MFMVMGNGDVYDDINNYCVPFHKYFVKKTGCEDRKNKFLRKF